MRKKTVPENWRIFCQMMNIDKLWSTWSSSTVWHCLTSNHEIHTELGADLLAFPRPAQHRRLSFWSCGENHGITWCILGLLLVFNNGTHNFTCPNMSLSTSSSGFHGKGIPPPSTSCLRGLLQLPGMACCACQEFGSHENAGTWHIHPSPPASFTQPGHQWAAASDVVSWAHLSWQPSNVSWDGFPPTNHRQFVSCASTARMVSCCFRPPHTRAPTQGLDQTRLPVV